MKRDYEWHVESDDGHEPPARSRNLNSATRFWISAITVLLLLGGGWQLLNWRIDRERQQAQRSVQEVLDFAATACRSGDSERFYLNQDSDSAWQSALLRPEVRAAYCAGPVVNSVQRHEDEVWAEVAWREPAGEQKRVMFFRVAANELVQFESAAAYWGRAQSSRHPWGTLRYFEIDHDYAGEVAGVVHGLVDQACAAQRCLAERQPFTLEMRPDYRRTATPNLLALPSPWLVALDNEGRPSPAYWDELRQLVAAQLTPGVIRFAVPASLQAQPVDYAAAAADFNRENPDLRVEIVPLDDSAAAALNPADYDGAAFVPTASMVAAGQVLDLSDFAGSDPGFDQFDYYEQVWQGARWRDRLWLLPQAAQMRLVFLDRQAYEAAGLAPPSLRWTWEEMERDIRSLMAHSPAGSGESWSGRWGFLDPNEDTLLTYAYGRQLECAGERPVTCNRPLGAGDLTAAFDWYRQLVAQGAMPDAAVMPPAERATALANWQGVPRQAAIWVDDAVNFEHYWQLWPIEVVPLPGSDRFEGNTPLWVHGSFISEASARPRDVWRWLVFLSYQPPNGPLRYVPARPSVAEQRRYWSILPRPLGEALRAAFPFARPVTLPERERLSRAQLEAVVEGRLSPHAAAQITPATDWFGRAPASD